MDLHKPQAFKHQRHDNFIQGAKLLLGKGLYSLFGLRMGATWRGVDHENALTNLENIVG